MRNFFYALILLLYCLSAQADEHAWLAVVVNKEVASKNMSQRELMLVYKRKLIFWDNGQRIQAANLPLEHPARRQFSLAILKSLPESQSGYWNDLYYHGISPPHVISSAEAMLRFVADTKGAIGYLPACMADERLQTLFWIDDNLQLSAVKPELNCH